MSKENNFNIIRFIATIMVIAGHMGVLVGGYVPTFLNQGLHGCGVKILFTISGYLIISSWNADPNLLRYIIKRFFRIVPPLAVCILISVFIIGPIFTTVSLKDYFSSPITWDYLRNIIFDIKYNLPAVFTNNPYPDAVNGSLWTLPIEVLLYCLVPVVLIAINKCFKHKDIVKFILAILVCTLYVVQQRFYPDWGIKIAWVNISSTALMLICYYTMGLVFTIPKVKSLLSLPLAILLVMLFSCFDFRGLVKETILLALLPYFVFSMAFSRIGFSFFQSSKVEITYSLYLYAFVIEQAIIKITIVDWQLELNQNLLFVFSLLFTIIAATLSSFLVERPTQKLCKNIISRLKSKPVNETVY